MTINASAIISGIAVWWGNICLSWLLWGRVVRSQTSEPSKPISKIGLGVLPFFKQLILFGLVALGLRFFYPEHFNFIAGLLLGLVSSPLLYKLLNGRLKG